MPTLQKALEMEAESYERRAHGALKKLATDVNRASKDVSVTAEELRQFAATTAMIQSDLAVAEGLRRALELQADFEEPKGRA